MIDFSTALKAKLPFIGVDTDDPVNVKMVLHALSGKSVMPLPTAKAAPLGDEYLWWTDDVAQVTTDIYRKLCSTTATCIVVNAEKSNVLVYDVGVLPTPTSFYYTYLSSFVGEEQIPAIVQILKGLSLKAAQEVTSLTMARTGGMLPNEVRKTRQMMSGDHPGLTQLDTDFDFYDMPKPLQEWLDLNDAYFLNPNTPPQLVPRGLLLAGDPGVGKSMASRVLAKHWDVPCFRLDISMSLNRWLGESESRISRSLSLIEQNAPCVWLLDEAEKLFGSDGNEGTTQRILSQMLWWLQYHKSRVLTVMTTNDLVKLPKELYRAERLDEVIRLEKLPLLAAKSFALRVFQSVLGKVPTMKQQKTMRDALDKGSQGSYAHAEVRALVGVLIKQQGWLTEEK